MYVESSHTIGVYGRGLTQQVHGPQNIAMLVNLLLLKGNMGREGAGISPVRGHSNVQGQRTVGISEKPELVPLDRLARQFDFEPPRATGRTTVEVVEGVLDGSAKAFLSHVHSSIGKREPASAELKSELAIIAGIAKSTLPANSKVKWDEWVDDYAKVRDLIAETYPEEFHDFNSRLDVPGGFFRGNSARERQWKTESGRAQFTSPSVLSALAAPLGDGEFTLITLRSNDQFNTTIYGFSDRLRGLEGDCNMVLMNPEDMQRFKVVKDQAITLECASDLHIRRAVSGLRVQPFDLPEGCVAAYYPDTNALVPLDKYDLRSKTPAYKGTAVRVVV